MIAALILAALVMPATATPQNLDCGTIPMPPPGMYVAKPGFWEPDPIIKLREFWGIDKVCRGDGVVAAGWQRVQACNHGITDLIPLVGEDVTHNLQVCYFIHEEAHRHGWPGDHSGAIYWRGK